ncbi:MULTISPECIES: DNA-3-methyladenine glycosylase [Corynebacterium]|uniref:DNA-3-methyladenine glycosylase n=1 Tax=Corynebacterium TaxID=1716 RepID=UPI0011CCB5C3|nr:MULTISPECIES: DNA-3-methyladenine glycosylase [Corynebacterium]MCG7250259.1 DNA-3-methyladenine glycosylase [Corynebacterium striatum]TXS66163.1 3-methyladenine DNA glycosylase [Corynebacterium sp. LK14]GKH15703.1 putative 3-methyladenine DNA glycosylase [Corynebacterium striatum]HAT1170689.1 DNA-3-methyladenine glycosylase [Corynebacterium striatum]HAT1175618.1 DNA-3-methyladenine glycosylase [Corynebacterium striatum]
MIDFSAPADVVAPQLLGATLTFNGVSIRLTEVEAYLGEDDEAAHTYNGQTPRNAAMFGPPGRLYVYASYGIHRNGNIVCAPEGTGQGCLLRGGEVIEGTELAFRRRGTTDFHNLARGPGNLGKALGFTLEDNGTPIQLAEREQEPEWVCGPRIGISKNKQAPLRFWIPFDKTVSARRGLPPS